MSQLPNILEELTNLFQGAGGVGKQTQEEQVGFYWHGNYICWFDCLMIAFSSETPDVKSTKELSSQTR